MKKICKKCNNSLDNLQPLCASDNLSKGNKIKEEKEEVKNA